MIGNERYKYLSMSIILLFNATENNNLKEFFFFDTKSYLLLNCVYCTGS